MLIRRLPNWILSGSAVLFCAACALLQAPAARTRGLAEAAGLTAFALPDERLRAFVRPAPGGRVIRRLTIYIESDGAPWPAPDLPPRDPTPLRPVVLRLALADPSPALAYLGRPCQYLDAADLAQCDPALWRRGRFGAEVIATMNSAVDRLKRHYAAGSIDLVGYSGGGAIAALVAAQRSDVNCLVTIASPLDTDAWTSTLGISALTASLNPADFADRLHGVAQSHFRGGRDERVPPATGNRFLRKVPAVSVIDKEGFDHECCWEDAWPSLRQESCLGE